MEHKTPSQEIFDEIRETSKKFWMDNYSDEFGYVTEKTSRIDSLTNLEDNVMICYRMFDPHNQQRLRMKLSQETLYYIDENQ